MALLFSLYHQAPDRFRRTWPMKRCADSIAPDPIRISPLAMAAEIDLVQSLLQVGQGRADGLFGLFRDRLHALQTPDHAGAFAAEQARQSRFQPMAGARRIGAVLGPRPPRVGSCCNGSSRGSDGRSGTALPPTSRSTRLRPRWAHKRT